MIEYINSCCPWRNFFVLEFLLFFLATNFQNTQILLFIFLICFLYKHWIFHHFFLSICKLFLLSYIRVFLCNFLRCFLCAFVRFLLCKKSRFTKPNRNLTLEMGTRHTQPSVSTKQIQMNGWSQTMWQSGHWPYKRTT